MSKVARYSTVRPGTAPRFCYRSISMIKDTIINLEHQVARDPARDFAISIAEICDTHLAGVAFAYTPEFPGYVVLELPPDIVAQMTAESEKSAMVAIERFDAAAKRSLISVEHRLLRTIGAEAPAILATLARRFDLSVFMQSEPGRVDNDDMIETALFESGRPLIVLNEKTSNDGNEIRGVEMAAHLARHDVKVEIEIVPAPDIDVTNAILS